MGRAARNPSPGAYLARLQPLCDRERCGRHRAVADAVGPGVVLLVRVQIWFLNLL